MKITKGPINSPLRLVIYGLPGIGKSTLASGMPDPIFFNTEEGTDQLNVSRTQRLKTLEQFYNAVDHILSIDEYKTVVVDTITAVEQLVRNDIVKEYNRKTQAEIKSIGEIPYGKGATLLRDEWPEVMASIEALYDSGRNVCLIGHAHVYRFADPERDAYDRYQLAMESVCAYMTCQRATDVFFINYDTTTKQVGKGFATREVAAAGTKRVLHTEHSAAFDAKNRHNLPARIILPKENAWQAIHTALVKGGCHNDVPF